MLRVSLRQIFSGKQTTEDFFQRDIMTKRPEQLTIAQFVDLTNQIEEQLNMFKI
jgi:16S rRNA (adenine1518-N6/adenine1519-N6)-dimethyltransferase